ncbi:hypothetical protein ACIGKQ_21170 [Gordonia sp. NPDC062954]|uniref:hypothetical protein n=1 Tax=Gordonia sp. NPDC062954 TaxID=3364003 RepID=UPI0037CB076E
MQPTPTDATPDSAATIRPLDRLQQATAQLVTFDEEKHPVINEQAAAQCVGIAQTIGQIDGAEPGCDVHSPRQILPSEQFMATVVKAELPEVGRRVDLAISKSRNGQLLAVESPAKPRARKDQIMDAIARHRLLILAIVVVGIIEWIIGTSWTQRVFDLTSDQAHLFALALPVVFALVGFAVAQGVLASMENRTRRIIRILMAVLMVCVVVMIACAGLIVSETVTKGTGGASGLSGGGLSGDVSTTADAGSDTTYHLVKLGVYVALLLMVTLLVMLLHLQDLWRERQKEVARDAEKAMNADTPAQITAANTKYLESFLDLYDSLLENREAIIYSYVAGARSALNHDLADVWTPTELVASPTEPKWVSDLREEIAELESVAADPQSPSVDQ